MRKQNLAQGHYNAFVKSAIEFLKIGVDDAIPTLDAKTDEELITERIVKVMNDRSTKGNLPFKLFRFDASDDSKVSHPDRAGKRRRRIDIRIVQTGRQRTVFEVEAKCLRKATNTIGDYTGSEGLLLFVTGEYARDHIVAGMIGYVQTDDPSYWKTELERKFNSDVGALLTVGQLTRLKGVAFENAYISEHQRKALVNIRIHHFLVPCC